jgi:hypothetical protein
MRSYLEMVNKLNMKRKKEVEILHSLGLMSKQPMVGFGHHVELIAFLQHHQRMLQRLLSYHLVIGNNKLKLLVL